LVKQKIQHPVYETLVARLLRNQALRDEHDQFSLNASDISSSPTSPIIKLNRTQPTSESRRMSRQYPSKQQQQQMQLMTSSDDAAEGSSPDTMSSGEIFTIAASPLQKLAFNQSNLKRAWDSSNKTTKDDWENWIRKFSVALLQESPSHALRYCVLTAEV
jgi:hypothetical protein